MKLSDMPHLFLSRREVFLGWPEAKPKLKVIEELEASSIAGLPAETWNFVVVHGSLFCQLCFSDSWWVFDTEHMNWMGVDPVWKEEDET